MKRIPLLSLIALPLLVAGCAGVPDTNGDGDPSPLPKADLIEAAEKTYTGYVDALNAVDLADPLTFEPVYDWITDDAYFAERKAMTGLSARGLVVAGESTVALFDAVVDGETVSARVCLDVSAVSLTAPDGSSAVKDERPEVQSLIVTFQPGETPTGMAIADSVGSDHAC